MKRLLVCLLMVGIAGCGGDSSPSSKNNGSPAQAPDTDPVAALEKLGAKIKRNEQGGVVGVRRSGGPVTQVVRGQLPDAYRSATLVGIRAVDRARNVPPGESSRKASLSRVAVHDDQSRVIHCG